MKIMFKWFDSAAKHPLANPGKAKKMLSSLPQDNPLKALDELSDWIESLSGMKLEARADICKLFDEYSQPYRLKLGRDHLNVDSVQQKRIGFVYYRFATLLGNAYYSCIESYRSGEKGADEIRSDLPLLMCRALNALKMQYKWAHLHSGPIEESIWKKLFWLFAFAEKIGITRKEIALYPAHDHTTSVNQEFLKTLMLSSSSPDALPPRRFEIASHIVTLLSAHFVLTSDAGMPHLTHYIDLSSNKHPSRLKTPFPNSATLRFFGPGQAYSIIHRLEDESADGQLHEITRGGTYSLEETRIVLKHLAVQWADRPPLRKNVRKQAVLPLHVTCSLDFIESETWTSENISDNGFDAIIQGDNPKWEKIGLLFFSRRAEQWDLCIIRRLNRDDLARWHVGVEILSKAIKPAALKAEEFDVRAAVMRLIKGGMEAEIVVDDDGFSPGASYEIRLDEKNYTLIPIELLEKGCNFKLWRFRVTNP